MLMPGVSARSSRIHMPCHATDSQHNAPVLDGVVRVVKHRADHPDLGAQRMAHHFRQPTRGDHLDVVVQQADDLTTGVAGAKIVDRRVVEGMRSEEHTSELQSLMRISYAVFCLKKKKKQIKN